MKSKKQKSAPKSKIKVEKKSIAEKLNPKNKKK